MHADGETDGGSASEPSAEPEPPEPGSPCGVSEDPTSTIVDVRCPAPGAASIDPAWIRDRAAAVIDRVAAEHDVNITRCTVRIVGDAEMSAAHRRFSRVSGPTDVLTFVSDSGDGLEVDLLACHDEASRRVASFEHDATHELLLYVVHGVLHAIGHDDHDPESHARMHAEEDRLLTLIGVGPVYRVEGSDG
ncbi:MAG: rRNA maturation RNase YbeY [Phycisphaerae bacterium]|nr:rRNA maturation RNase YbeY [Phycisphaerae bacterium]